MVLSGTTSVWQHLQLAHMSRIIHAVKDIFGPNLQNGEQNSATGLQTLYPYCIHFVYLET